MSSHVKLWRDRVGTADYDTQIKGNRRPNIVYTLRFWSNGNPNYFLSSKIKFADRFLLKVLYVLPKSLITNLLHFVKVS